ARASTWLFRIARNRASNAMRDRARQPDGYAESLTTENGGEGGAYEYTSTASHEDAVLDRVALAEGMSKLSPKHREVLDLFFYHGFTLDEVAHILDIPTGTAKSRLSYARRALLRELQGIAPLGGLSS
ncbi:MAG: RNA polymerase sigma factor, partial [Ktedonobacterales bacterium]